MKTSLNSRCTVSDLAWAYRREYEAHKHQGKQLVNADTGGSESTAEMIGRRRGISGRTVLRYIRLTYLLPPILDDYVNCGQVSLVAGEYLSHLSMEVQDEVLRCLRCGISIDKGKCRMLAMSYKRGNLKIQDIESILTGKKGRNRKEKGFYIPSSRLKAWFRGKVKAADLENELVDAMTISSLVRQFFPNATADEICATLTRILSDESQSLCHDEIRTEAL